MLYFFGKESSVSIKADLVIMELEESTSMGNSKKSDIELFCLIVKLSFNIHTYSTCAFIQYGE